MSNQSTTKHYIDVTAQDLPLTCPMPRDSLWNSHPRVGIPVTDTGEASCPYCGIIYRFTGELPKGHH